MTLVCRPTKLVIISIINIFYLQTTIALSIAEIKSGISSFCNDYENLPEKFCGKIIGPIESKVRSECASTIKTVCDDMPWLLKLLISTGTCEAKLESLVCRAIDGAIEFAENECEEELEKIVVGHGCDADGNKVNLCDGLPTTAEGVCTAVTDTMCEELPELLEPLVPYCQETLAKLICRDALNAVESVTSETSATPKYTFGWSVNVGLPGK